MQKSLITLAVAIGAAAALTGSAHAADGAEAAKQAPQPKHYTVAEGDSLSSIATDQKLDSWRPLWNVNTDLQSPDLIFPGEQLVIPDGPTQDRPLPAGFDAPIVAQAAPAAVSTVQPVRQTVSIAPAANYAAGIGGILARVRQRESGGNYATNTGNGFYGAYQFNLGTWRGVGGTGLPSDASPAEQDMRAQMLYSQRGCSPWPNTCY